MLCSCTLKEFLQLLETKVKIDEKTGSSDELQFVDEFFQILEDELPSVKIQYIILGIIV